MGSIRHLASPGCCEEPVADHPDPITDHRFADQARIAVNGPRLCKVCHQEQYRHYSDAPIAVDDHVYQASESPMYGGSPGHPVCELCMERADVHLSVTSNVARRDEYTEDRLTKAARIVVLYNNRLFFPPDADIRAQVDFLRHFLAWASAEEENTPLSYTEETYWICRTALEIVNLWPKQSKRSEPDVPVPVIHRDSDGTVTFIPGRLSSPEVARKIALRK